MKEQSLLEGNRSCKLTKEDKQIIAGIYSVIFFVQFSKSIIFFTLIDLIL